MMDSSTRGIFSAVGLTAGGSHGGDHANVSARARVLVADGKTEAEEAMVLGTLQELFGLSVTSVQQHLDRERSRRATR
ncbi:MAG: hypothetical protein ABI321_13945 [Polyangia bacterium]